MNVSSATCDALIEDGPYRLAEDGILEPDVPVVHRDESMDPALFEHLARIQKVHFWHRGRARFVLSAVRREIAGREPVRAVDLGGGCGGFIRYLRDHAPESFEELALADSGRQGLDLAANVVGPKVQRYHVDLMDLRWSDRWDAAFLLDVIEHLPDDVGALKQVRAALKPGGRLFVTVPAFNSLWSTYDDRWGHVRRYRKPDFVKVARAAGFRLRRARYFQFFLSPFYLMSRIGLPKASEMTPEQIRQFDEKMLKIPAPPLNAALSWAFSAETPLGHHVPFPFGTSLLGVFEKEAKPA